MPQNRNKFMDTFIGNLANAIVHEILEKSIIEELAIKYSNKYRNEVINSYNIAKTYREKINPLDKTLPPKDIIYIKDKIKSKVNSELQTRINKGYENINLNLVDQEIDEKLKELKVE